MTVSLDGMNFPLPELERTIGFRFLPQIAFESPEEKAEIQRRGLEKESVTSEERERGDLFRKEIEAASLPGVSIRSISETVGYGLFAEESIQPGSYAGEYTGIVRRNNRRYIEPLNHYCYRYPVLDHLGLSFVIDATQGNLTRFINHSSKPNLQPSYAFYDGFYHLIFLALREILPGEQLFYDYGPTYWQIRDKPEKL